MSQVPRDDQQNTPAPRQAKKQSAPGAEASSEMLPGLMGQIAPREPQSAPGSVQAKREPITDPDVTSEMLAGFLARDGAVSEADSANERLPGLRAKDTPISGSDSANEALPGFLASANLALSWWRNPTHPPVNTSPLPRIAQPQPRRRGRDTVLITAILAVLITFSGVFLGAATFRGQARATNNAGLSTAVVTASTYPFSKQPPALSDPLANASHASEYGWSGGKMCAFFTGAYHAMADTGRAPTYCLATSHSFSDFSFQAQMTIESGGKGGLVFRADEAQQQFYLLSIDAQGNFELLAVKGASHRVLQSGSAGTAFHTGFHQTNLIAVTARGSQLSLYFNQLQKEPPFTYTDPTPYSGGQLGFFASYEGSATDVAYSRIQVWAL
ncbi:MAG TPA: hypothetical protein VF458_14085 [Ktedonobacteraceae bacterium]